MKTFLFIFNILLTAIILVCGISIIIDYRKTKDQETISPEELKGLRKTRFNLAMLTVGWLLIAHIERFF